MNKSQISENYRKTENAYKLSSNSEFLSLWFVGGILNILRWLELLAVGIVVFDMTASPFYVALMVTMRFLPMLFLGFFSGAIVERINRRLGLIVIFLLMAFASFFYGLEIYFGQISFWLICTSVIFNGILWALDNPLRRTLFADVVKPEQIGTAMTLDSLTSNFTRFLGPFLGGLFLEYYGIEGVFFLGAIIYLLSLLVTTFGTRTAGIKLASNQEGILTELTNGLILLRKDRTLKGILAVTIVFNLWGFPFVSLIPVIGKEVLELSPFLIGLLVSTEGLGAIIGSLVIVSIARINLYRKFYTYGVFLFLLMGFSFAQSSDFISAVICMFFTGVGWGCFSAMQATLIMFCTPLVARGRMMGLLTASIGLNTVGIFHIGLLANLLGTELAILVSTTEGFIMLIFVCRLWPEIIAPQLLPSD